MNVFKFLKVLLKQLCKYGLPEGNVFEFAAKSIEKFEKKQIEKKILEDAAINC